MPSTREDMVRSYERACNALSDFKTLNASLFDKLATLEGIVEKVETELREYCKSREISLEVPSLETKFSFTQPYQQSVDFDVAMKLIHEKLFGPERERATQTLIEISSTETKVDKEKFMKKIQSKDLPSVLRSALQEKKLTPRISKISLHSTQEQEYAA